MDRINILKHTPVIGIKFEKKCNYYSINKIFYFSNSIFELIELV